MIRTFIIPDSQHLSLTIPKKYVGKELEVIVFSKREVLNDNNHVDKKVSFASIKINTKGFKFNRDEANER